MSEWIDFDRWPDCIDIARPGIIFEVTNNDQTLFTNCVIPLLLPFDWESEPVRFRAVPEPEPRHSSPLPKSEEWKPGGGVHDR